MGELEDRLRAERLKAQGAKSNVRFKDDSVAKEYESLNPSMKSLVEGFGSPLTVTSGARDPMVNASVGGMPNSAHLTGNAVDLRYDGNMDSVLNYMRSKGAKAVPEADHLHVQDYQESAPAPVDYEARLKARLAQTSPNSMSSESAKRDLTESYVKAGKDWLGASTAFASGIGESVPFTSLAKDIGYKITGGQKPSYETDYPLAKTAGRVGGDIVSAMTSLPSISQSLGSSFFKRAVGMGAANALTGQSKRGLEINPGMTAFDFLSGVGGEALSSTISGASSKVDDLLTSPVGKRIATRWLERVPAVGTWLKGKRELAEEVLSQKDKVASLDLAEQFAKQEAPRLAEYEAGKAQLKADYALQESKRKLEHELGRESAEKSLRSLSIKTPEELGSSLLETSSEAARRAGQQYGAVRNPLIKEYGEEVVSSQPLRDEILSVFEREGMVNKKGTVIAKKIEDELSPTRKKLFESMLNTLKKVKKNKTVSELEQLTKGLQSLGFQSEVPTVEQAIYRKLSGGAKESVESGLSSLAGPEAGQALSHAKAQFSSTKPIYEELEQLGKKFPEQIASGVNTNLPPSFVMKAIEKEPALKEPLADVVEHYITRRSPGMLSEAIDKYGRENLLSLLGSKRFDSLMNAEAALSKAYTPFQSAMRPEAIPFEKGMPPELIPSRLDPTWIDEAFLLGSKSLPYLNKIPYNYIPRGTTSLIDSYNRTLKEE